MRPALRAPRRLAWIAGAAVATVALSCTLLIETRSVQCNTDADCTGFPHAACDPKQHICVDQGCATGNCVCTPMTPTDILNACPRGTCTPFDNTRVPADAGAGSGDAGSAPAPTYSCPAGTGGGDAGTMDGGTGSVPVCETLPGTKLYLIGPTSIQPLLVWVAQIFGKQGTTLVYQDDSSCVGVEKMFVATEGMENDPGNEAWTTYFDQNGDPHPCKFVAGNIRPDIGLSDVFAQTCNYNTSGTDQSVIDTAGPVQAFGFIVPDDPASTQTSISAEAAYAVYSGAGIAPWTDERYVFQRNTSSGTQNMIATALGIPAGQFHATTSQSSDDEAALVGCAPAKDKALGILAVDLAESKTHPVRLLAYQHYKQQCGYLPDSSATANDKRNVRDGHYFIWGPAHLMTRKDSPNNAATLLINYIAGVVPPPADEPLDIFTIWSNAHLVPQCAMRVTRSSDSGPLSSFKPATSCYCKYDEVTTGQSGCTTCKTSADCPPTQPACSPYGYCEPQ